MAANPIRWRMHSGISPFVGSLRSEALFLPLAEPFPLTEPFPLDELFPLDEPLPLIEPLPLDEPFPLTDGRVLPF